MMRKILCFIFFYYSLTPLFPQNRITLDNAITDFAEYTISQLPTSNRRIAIIAFETSKRDLMLYVIDTLLEKILEKGTGLVIVERQRIENLQRELNFSLTGYVSDETAQRIGHFIGANTVIYGSLTTSVNLPHFTLRATDVETSQILATKSYDLIVDSKLSGLLQINRNEARLWTVGVSVGSSFSRPLIIGTVRGTIAPFRYSFLELGVDAGFLSRKTDEIYYSIYPFAHYAFFWPFDRGGLYIGAGVGYMMGNISYQDGRDPDPIRIIAADGIIGANIMNVLDISYTIKTTFRTISNKFSVGYTYRFK
jgi:hypothetical protein